MARTDTTGELPSMKRLITHLLLAATLCTSVRLFASAPSDTQATAAQAAATSWLAILDSGDYMKATSGFADEVLAEFKYPTQDEKLHAAAYMILDPANRKVQSGSNPTVTRTLKPDGVQLVDTCNCLVHKGPFYAFTYDVKYTWDEPRYHIHRQRDGTDTVYMLREPNGTWKPASIASTYGR